MHKKGIYPLLQALKVGHAILRVYKHKPSTNKGEQCL